ncbi:MAG: hypothetical protein ACOYI4_01870 [Christensenellales bacterium]|jgi:hypothetical protein
MIEKILCEPESEKAYENLSEERKLVYQDIYKKATCCPERYIMSVDVSNGKDQSCVVKFNHEEYLKGNMVVESIDYF